MKPIILQKESVFLKRTQYSENENKHKSDMVIVKTIE